MHPGIWRPFYGGSGLTEYYPRKGAAIAQNGSDGVMNFIAAGSGNGSIGYDEYSYALGKNYPVAKILNSGGYYTLPNQYNVAVALTQAKLNLDKIATRTSTCCRTSTRSTRTTTRARTRCRRTRT